MVLEASLGLPSQSDSDNNVLLSDAMCHGDVLMVDEHRTSKESVRVVVAYLGS